MVNTIRLWKACLLGVLVDPKKVRVVLAFGGN